MPRAKEIFQRALGSQPWCSDCCIFHFEMVWVVIRQ